MIINPYLNFDGRCEEALTFYRQAVGAKIGLLMRNRDCPPPPDGAATEAPANGEKVLHASFTIGGSTLMATDGSCRGQARFAGMTLSLTADDVASAERYFAALAVGGQVQLPLTKTFFSPSFGMLVDQFGVAWMVTANP